MVARTSRTPEKEAAFLTALAEGRSIGAAAELAGVGRRTVYDWREADPEFASAWTDAETASTE